MTRVWGGRLRRRRCFCRSCWRMRILPARGLALPVIVLNTNDRVRAITLSAFVPSSKPVCRRCPGNARLRNAVGSNTHTRFSRTDCWLRRRAGEARFPGCPNGRFGAGAQGFTPVGRLPLGFFEHRISWYTERGAPGVTFGESGRDSGVQDSHQQLLGRVCTNSLRGSVFEFLQPYAETPGGVEPRACLFSINDQ